ncbi:MAG: hypothetical protein ACE5KL_08260 [Alphaproteobacteria bacterium]
MADFTDVKALTDRSNRLLHEAIAKAEQAKKAPDETQRRLLLEQAGRLKEEAEELTKIANKLTP